MTPHDRPQSAVRRQPSPADRSVDAAATQRRLKREAAERRLKAAKTRPDGRAVPGKSRGRG